MKKIDLQHKSVLTNNNTAKLIEKLSHEFKKTQTFDFSFEQSISKSAKYFENFSIHGSISSSNLGFSARFDKPAEFVMEIGKNKSFAHSYSNSVSSEVTFKIEKTVEVPPDEKIEVLSYVNWVDNLALSYKANVKVTGLPPRFESDSRLDADSIKVLLSKYGFDERLIEETAHSLTFEVRGNLIGSFGLDTVFSINLLGKTHSTTENYKLIKKQSLVNNVPAKIDEKNSLIQVKRGESARLKCNAFGDQPLTVIWTKNNVKLDKHGGQNYDIFETTKENGIISELLLRNTQITDGTIYKCEAENENGKDEGIIELIFVERQSSDVFLISTLTAGVIAIIVIIFAFVCVRRIRHRDTTNSLMMDSPTISNPLNSTISTTSRNMDFDKACEKPLMLTEQTKIHPPPYTSLPREETESNQ